jgi:hypothetical protein
MAVSLNAEYTRTAEYRFLPENIEIRPELNGRHDKPDIEWLVADILRFGQHSPCPFWKDGDTPVLAAGFSRWRAVSEINKRKLTPKPIELRCTYVQTNEVGAFLRNISENRMRKEVSAVDDAHNIQRLIEAYQMSEEEIAKVYFPTAATESEIKEAVKWTRARIDLIRLTPEAERAMTEGRLDETAAAAISKLTSAQQREALEKGGKVTAKDVKALKTKKPKKPKPVKIESELKRRITAVLESADWDSFDEKKGFKICVNAEALASLKSYVLPEEK